MPSLLAVLFTPLCLLFAVSALAQQPQTLDTVVVTASRVAQSTDETLASVTVITRDDIEKLQAHSVPDILRRQPGLQVHTAGGRGKSTSVFMRGTNSDHVLVLVDGIRTGSATLGTTALQDIPIASIERIEIVRGPRSSLYGSEAIGGVIQIFTHRGGDTLQPYASLGVGSYDTIEGSAGLRAGTANAWFNLGVSGVDTRGFDACQGEAATAFAGCFTDEPDRDGYTNLSASLRAGYRFLENLELDVFGLFTDAENEFDGSFQNASEDQQRVLGSTLRYTPLSNWQLTLRLGHSLDQSENFKDGVFASRFRTKRDTLSWQNDLSLGDHTLLTLGADYLNDRIDSSNTFAKTSRDNVGVFAQYLGYWGDYDIQLSMRSDDNEQFGDKLTGNLALGYMITSNLRVIGAYGTAFKAPSFNALYFPGYGNPNLAPEASQTLELGLVGSFTQGDWSFYVYETKVEDLIAHDASISMPANIDQARIHGAELSWQTTVQAFEIQSALSWTQAQNRAASHHGKLLPRRPEQVLNLDMDRAFDRYRVGASLLAQGRSFDDVANTRRLDGFATVDMRAEYLINSDWRVQLRLENLFDEDYETAAFYNQPGRSASLTLRYQRH